MQSHSRQSYVLPGIGTLIAEQAKKIPIPPLLRSCALVLVTMLIMVISALLLGAWWDRLGTGI
jgi:hypothetical protein